LKVITTKKMNGCETITSGIPDAAAESRWHRGSSHGYALRLALVFVHYLAAGKLGLSVPMLGFAALCASLCLFSIEF